MKEIGLENGKFAYVVPKVLGNEKEIAFPENAFLMVSTQVFDGKWDRIALSDADAVHINVFVIKADELFSFQLHKKVLHRVVVERCDRSSWPNPSIDLSHLCQSSY